ncbi:MAG: PucR family transcriptional regulator, partial [Solirubrobacteraceae bacterium]
GMKGRVAITVRQLVEVPHLRTRFHCGRAGGEQVINWAHTCEMPDPWHWLEPFDMLMTNGIGLPADPDEQARYLSRLADAGISAVAIGEDVGAPAISPAMVSASERRALPILLTAYEVPFAAVARVVADSRADLEERRRLTKTARIYELLRTATIEGRGAVHLLHELGAELGCRLEVLDLASWREAFAPATRAPAAVRDVLRDALARCAGHLPAILRLDLEGGVGLAVPVPARRSAALLAGRFTEAQPELSVLQHVSTVAALELEKLASERDALSRAGAKLLADLLTVRLDAAEAATRLAAANLSFGSLVVAAWRDEPSGPRAVHQELFARGVPHLLRADGNGSIALALLRDTEGAQAMLREALPEGCPVGLSAEVAEPDRVLAAAREARWALHGCAPARSRVVRYGTGGALPWGFTLERAEEVAGHVLGSLVQYDRLHQTELLSTLAALLRNDRSPTRTAAELFIHRQTLVYRVRRIEELTERSLSRTSDMVELWLAMRALEIVNGSAPDGVG